MSPISTNFQIDDDLADLTPRELAEQIIGRLEKTFSIELMPILEAETLTERQKMVRFKDTLYNGILQRAERENLSDFFASPQDLTERAEGDDLESEIGAGVEEIDPVPLLAMAERDAEFLKSLRGEDLKFQIATLAKRFEAALRAEKLNELAGSLLLAHVVAIGSPFAVATARALQSGAGLLSAVRTGILAIGFKVAISLAVDVFTVLLQFMCSENPKRVLSLVINETDEDFVVRNFRRPDGDLFVNAGSVLNFMEDKLVGEAPIQLMRMLRFGPGDKDNLVLVGFYYIEKDPDPFGAEALALFSSRTFDLRFAHLSGSPLTGDKWHQHGVRTGQGQGGSQETVRSVVRRPPGTGHRGK